MQCEPRDCVLQQQKSIGGKTGETQIMSGSSGPSLFGARDWFLEDNFPTDWECGGDDLGMV